MALREVFLGRGHTKKRKFLIKYAGCACQLKPPFQPVGF
jgi:hypothetical protein